MEQCPHSRQANKNRFARRLLLVSFGLAVLVGCVSPDIRTVIYLGGAVLLQGLILLLHRFGSRCHWLAMRLDPRIVLMAITFCMCAATSELAVRFFLRAALPDWSRKGPAPLEGLGFQHNARLGWFPIPNDHRLLKVGTRTITLSHNSDGFRDEEPVWDARPRIIFIGDSFLWGSSLEAKERFTDKLRARHPEWALYNFGVVGYGNDQEYLLLQSRFEKYHPQAVFLLFCAENDFQDNCSNGGGTLVFKPYFSASPAGLKLHGTPVPVPDYVFCQRHAVFRNVYLVRLAMRAWGNLRCPSIKIFQRDITFQLLEALRKYVVEHGAKLYVGLTVPEPEIEKFLQRSKVPWVELNTELRIEDGLHWNAEGNTVVADKVEQFLKEQRFGNPPGQTK